MVPTEYCIMHFHAHTVLVFMCVSFRVGVLFRTESDSNCACELWRFVSAFECKKTRRHDMVLLGGFLWGGLWFCCCGFCLHLHIETLCRTVSV